MSGFRVRSRAQSGATYSKPLLLGKTCFFIGFQVNLKYGLPKRPKNGLFWVKQMPGSAIIMSIYSRFCRKPRNRRDNISDQDRQRQKCASFFTEKGLLRGILVRSKKCLPKTPRIYQFWVKTASVQASENVQTANLKTVPYVIFSIENRPLCYYVRAIKKPPVIGDRGLKRLAPQCFSAG